MRMRRQIIALVLALAAAYGTARTLHSQDLTTDLAMLLRCLHSSSICIGSTTFGAGASLPASCATGDGYLKTTATVGIYYCASANTWTVGSGAGPSSKASWTAQTTTVRTVKGTAGTVTGYYVYNPNSSVAYVQLFDVASGTAVTLGTTVPDITLGIPATSGANLIGDGLTFSNGIKFACTTTATGNTAPGTGLDVNIYYQ